MANENGTKKPNFFVRVGRWFKNLGVKIGKAFYNMFHEMKKVTWPNKKTVLKNTGTVLLCSLLIGVCIWVFDFVAVSAVQMLIGG